MTKMTIISSIKKFFRSKRKIRKIKVFYIKAFKSNIFTENFIEKLRKLNFDVRNVFIRSYENIIVYIILKKGDTLFLFMPKSYMEKIKVFAEAHKIKITGAEDI